jgi:PAS domain S-box-containing protein
MRWRAMNPLRSVVRAFAVALLAVAVLTLARYLVLIPVFGFDLIMIPAITSIIVAAWLAGPLSGLIATVLTICVLCQLETAGFSAVFFSAERLIRIVTFLFIGAVISWGVDAVHTVRRRTEDHRRELEEELRWRKQVQAELRESEERIRLAVEAADIGTFDFNPITGEKTWSERTKVMFGLPPDADVSNVSFRDRVHPDDRELVEQAIRSALDPRGTGAYRLECRLVWPDSTVHWFVAKGQAMFEGEGPQRRATRFLGTIIDITHRKRAEQELRQAEETFRTLATHAPVGIFQTDPQGAGLFANEAWYAITGAAPEQALGHAWIKLVHPDDRARVFQIWQDATRDHRNNVAEFRFLNDRTGIRWVVASTTPILDAAGIVTGFVGTMVDLTERKAVEDVVKASEARLRGILDNTPAVISLKDLQGRYVLVNRGWQKLFGVSHEEIVGLTNEELLRKTRSSHMSREIADHFLGVERTVLETGEAVEFEDPVQYGEVPQFFFTVKFPIRDADNQITGIGGISVDITERRLALDALAAEQELLNHTIALQDHERQLIAYEIHDGLIQYVTGALMQLEAIQSNRSNGSAGGEMERVVGVLRRAVAEGRQLLDGIRTPVLDGLGVAAAIENLIQEEERAHVQVEFVQTNQVGRMDAKIEEAIYRITQEALTNTGKHSRSKNVRVELKRQGEKVQLEVRDWGVGFTPPMRVHGAVHGLRGMMERARIAGGSCTIVSAPGDGTRVLAELPYVLRS